MKKHYSNVSSPVPALSVEKLGLRELTAEEKIDFNKNVRATHKQSFAIAITFLVMFLLCVIPVFTAIRNRQTFFAALIFTAFFLLFALIVIAVLLKTRNEITMNLTKSRIVKAPGHFQACKLSYGGCYGGSAFLVKVWEFNEWFRVGREYSYIQNTQENACLEIYAYDMKNGFFKLFLVTTC